MEQQTKPTNVGTPNATVKLREFDTIKGDKLKYVEIHTLKGYVYISIGEKNFKALGEILEK